MCTGATPASAAEFHLETVSGATLVGHQILTNSFATDSGTIHCSIGSFSGSTSASTTSKLEVTPSYSGCRSTGFIEAEVTIDNNSCKYVLEASGFVRLEPFTCSMVVTAPFCTITVKGGQTLLSNTYFNVGSGSGRYIVVWAHVTNVAYSESGFACKNSGSNTTGGSYSGEYEIYAKNSGKVLGLWWE